MLAARTFLDKVLSQPMVNSKIRCTLKGSLAYTGKGHATDRAIMLGLHGYAPQDLTSLDVDVLVDELSSKTHLTAGAVCGFNPETDIIFDRQETLPQHPNGMIFEYIGDTGEILLTKTYFSIGGGFIKTLDGIDDIVAPLQMESALVCPFSFGSGQTC